MRQNLVIAAALLLSLSPALAQQQAPAPQAPAGGVSKPSPELKAARQAMRQACTDDARSLCAGSESGGGKIMMCLRSHQAQLSDGCKAAAQHLRDVRRGA